MESSKSTLQDPSLHIEQGQQGLFYATNADRAGVFIAASTLIQAIEAAGMALAALDNPALEVPGHVLHDHSGGQRITIPAPGWMTPAQRQETVERLEAHLKVHVLN